ncbi:MAG TPA: DUF4149 domain-containing protein [Terriglobales bacterium]|nr:DUF4149 domain-containing protein [Terriglobales bacterium]
MNFLKSMMLAALGVWVGGIVFFSAVEAPLVLGYITDRVLAGAMISGSLHKLHTLGMICGLVFIFTSLAYSRVVNGELRAASATNIAAALMVALTAVSQYSILPAIARLRVSQPNAEQFAEFERLHTLSVGAEGATLLIGLVLLYLMARRLS